MKKAEYIKLGKNGTLHFKFSRLQLEHFLNFIEQSIIAIGVSKDARMIGILIATILLRVKKKVEIKLLTYNKNYTLALPDFEAINLYFAYLLLDNSLQDNTALAFTNCFILPINRLYNVKDNKRI